MKSTPSPFALLLLTAAVLGSFSAGILNGIIGTGGGILFMLLARLLGVTASDSKNCYAFAMMCVIPTSVVSLLLYPTIPLSPGVLAKLFLTGIGGGIGGAWLKEKIKTSWLNLAFASLTVYAGISMLTAA